MSRWVAVRAYCIGLGDPKTHPLALSRRGLLSMELSGFGLHFSSCFDKAFVIGMSCDGRVISTLRYSHMDSRNARYAFEMDTPWLSQYLFRDRNKSQLYHKGIQNLYLQTEMRQTII